MRIIFSRNLGEYNLIKAEEYGKCKWGKMDFLAFFFAIKSKKVREIGF
ncbi:hypothetical protein GFC30_1967 [Anoxybacillus amylolyticus]|uniref:Uncharacterized protein n=1 Tax=Anoxybacteroides amylolyticum TaxID=294699 RepID=A0A160F4P3_9BACL|nr:hypothetical protein GFC30_1967 [Anoxybacillus amylolyticus]